MELHLTQEQVERAKALCKNGATVQDVLSRAVEHGLYRLEYTRDQYPKRKEEQKLARRVLSQARRDPELAVKLGLAHRVNQ